ncbi:hypothetical protein [Nitrospirillum sp. BR 11163]|uniref:hypothetical protein n=1 Tax=Nitrospirillum sp. BR 11163 TaxID=3104323 RepID=UPI002AFDD992|nr:hypothetical protein [Nitrospirillum sp. BR 11163]MEA1674092.1 hypothetical protein [Nitrospirillum sp. BR 11163]
MKNPFKHLASNKGGGPEKADLSTVSAALAAGEITADDAVTMSAAVASAGMSATDLAKRLSDAKAAKAKADSEGGGEEDDPNREDDEEDDQEAVAAAVKAERARCCAIFASEHAADRIDMAASLAFTTDLTADQAVNLLSAAAKGRQQGGGSAKGFGELMRQFSPTVGSDDAPAPGAQGGDEAAKLAAEVLAAAGIAPVQPRRR